MQSKFKLQFQSLVGDFYPGYGESNDVRFVPTVVKSELGKFRIL